MENCFIGFGAPAPAAAAPAFGANTGLGGSSFGGFSAAPAGSIATTAGKYY